MTFLEGISALHPALVHYPIAFLVYGLGCDVFARFTRRRTSPFAEWTLAIGVLTCLPAMVSGWLAAAELFAADPETAARISFHNIAAYALFFGATMYAGVRMGERVGEWRAPAPLKMLMGVLLTIAIFATGFTGGTLTTARAVASCDTPRVAP